jgi:hypothetical protein
LGKIGFKPTYQSLVYFRFLTEIRSALCGVAFLLQLRHIAIRSLQLPTVFRDGFQHPQVARAGTR